MDEVYYVLYQLLMTLSMAASILIIVMTVRRRREPGAIAMTFLALGTFVWTLGYFLESHGATLSKQLLFNNIGYIGSMTVPVAWFLFAFNYKRDSGAIKSRQIMYSCLVPVLTIILVWTNDWHHLMWANERLTESGPFIVTSKEYRWAFWVALIHNYVLIVAGAALLLRRLSGNRRLYQNQGISLLVAVLLPLLWNIIYVFHLLPIPRKDLTPATFAISGILIVVGLMKYRLFDIIPFSSQFIMQNLDDGIMMLDPARRLINANPASLRLLGIDDSWIGERIDKPSHLPQELVDVFQDHMNNLTIGMLKNGEKHFLEVKKIPVGESNMPAGFMIVLRDITEREKALENLRRSEENLRVSMNESPLGIRIIDAEEKELYVNQAFLDIFGYGCLDDMEKTPVINLYAEKDREIFRNLRDKRLHGETGAINYKIDITRTDGTGRRVEIFQRRVLWNGVNQYQLLYNDITAEQND